MIHIPRDAMVQIAKTSCRGSLWLGAVGGAFAFCVGYFRLCGAGVEPPFSETALMVAEIVVAFATIGFLMGTLSGVLGWLIERSR